MPKSATIEITNYCNLRCPVCDQQQVSSRKFGQMTFEEFKLIIDEIGIYLENLGMSDTGETFINKDAYLMISYAKKKFPHLYIYLDTNGHFIDPEKLLTCGIDKISFSIDGLTQDVYEKYRVGGKLETVLKNLNAIKIWKLKNFTETKLELKFIVMKHNEHQLDSLKKFSTDYDFDEIRLEKFTARGFLNKTYSESESIRLANMFTSSMEQYSKYDLIKSNETGLLHSYLIQSKGACSVPWIETEILWNGDVRPCVVDFDSEYVFGNIFKSGSFRKVWNSKVAQKFRMHHAKKLARDIHNSCSTCAYSNLEHSKIAQPRLKAKVKNEDKYFPIEFTRNK